MTQKTAKEYLKEYLDNHNNEFPIVDTIGVEHIHNGDYVIFQKKASK